MSNIGLENAKSCLITLFTANKSVLPTFDLQIYGYSAEEVNADGSTLGDELIATALVARGIPVDLIGEVGLARPVRFFGANGRPRI